MDAYQLIVIWSPDPNSVAAFPSFGEEIFERPFAGMRTFEMPFVDALILNPAERTPGADHFTTWKAKHFQEKPSLPVPAPEAYLVR